MRLIVPALFGALLFFLYVYLPRATVILHPETREISDKLEMRAEPTLQQVDARAARIPLRARAVVVEVSERWLTEGRKAAPDAHALGTVTFANRQSGAATVPAGTVLLTPSGARFVTTADAVLGQDQGSTARAPIRAVEPGEHGNVARLEINRIVGSLAERISVLNEEKTTGGGRSDVPQVSETDRQRARDLTLERVRREALQKLKTEAGSKEVLVEGSLELTTLDERFDRQLGEETPSFGFTMQARLSGGFVLMDDVREVAKTAWRPSAPPGFFIPPEQTDVMPPALVRRDGSALVVASAIRSLAVAQIDTELIRGSVRGRPPEDAGRAVARLNPGQPTPTVMISPSWMSRANRVDIVLDLNPPAGAQSG